MTAGLAVGRWARRTPDADALVDARGVLSWRQVDGRVSRLASVLARGHGVGAGQTVALLSENRREVPEILAAVHRAGGVYVGLNFRFDAQELRGALANAEPRVLLASGDLFEQAAPVAAEFGIPVIGLDETGPQGYEALLTDGDEGFGRVEFDPAEPACIVYTSGTTGSPKGILFDHAAMTQHATITCLEYEISARSRYLVQIPHNSSVNITMLPCLMVGATVAFADSRSFDPVRFADTVAGLRISHTFLVPTQLMRIIDQLPAHDSRLRSLLTLGYGSSPIAPDRLRELLSRYGPIFIQLYGMAEIASIGTLLRKSDHVRALADMPQLLRSCGRPSLGVDVRVVDDDGREVAPGERGEVVFRGVHLMRGYYRDPERTAETLRDGRVYSGDIGEYDADGYFFIVDRKKNIIIRGGQNIVPTEIENTLFEHPSVLEAAVVGAPDPVWGERIVAVVALRDGAHVTPADLTAHIASSGLTSFKRPEEVRIVSSLPKNPVGKIDKKEIRGWFWRGDRSV